MTKANSEVESSVLEVAGDLGFRRIVFESEAVIVGIDPKRPGSRDETPQAWKMTVEDVKACGYNLDIKNPHTIADNYGDPELCLRALLWRSYFDRESSSHVAPTVIEKDFAIFDPSPRRARRISAIRRLHGGEGATVLEFKWCALSDQPSKGV